MVYERHVRMAVGVVVLSLCTAAVVAAQTMEKVDYFPNSIAEKDDLVVQLNGGSSWLLANRTSALAATDVIVVMRDVMVNGASQRRVVVHRRRGDSRQARGGVHPRNPAYLTRVVGAEGGTTSSLQMDLGGPVPKYDNCYVVSRWTPPYKARCSRTTACRSTT